MVFRHSSASFLHSSKKSLCERSYSADSAIKHSTSRQEFRLRAIFLPTITYDYRVSCSHAEHSHENSQSLYIFRGAGQTCAVNGGLSVVHSVFLIASLARPPENVKREAPCREERPSSPARTNGAIARMRPRSLQPMREDASHRVELHPTSNIPKLLVPPE